MENGKDKTKTKNNHSPRPPELWGGVVSPTIRTLEPCFFTNRARFRFYPTKIPPFEREFHAEFEHEGPGASFFDFDIVVDYLYIEKTVGTPFFHQLGTV